MTSLKNVLCAAALVGTTAMITTVVVSQHEGPSEEEMMAKWIELGTPGEVHEQMMKAEGTWHNEQMNWMAPDAPPMTSTSVSKMKSIMGGRYMIQHLEGEMDMGMGPQQFEGMGLYGFDNYTKEPFFVWVDNHSTMMMVARGEVDSTGKVTTYYSEMADPMTGGTTEIKSVATIVSDNEQTFEMFMKMEEKWFQNMKIVSTRAE